jgi:hypothetical protein
MTKNRCVGFGADIPDEDVKFGALTSDDMDAIKAYFVRTNAVTSEATKIKNEFTKWFDGLWWFEKTSQASFDLARNQRNRFNLANAITPEEKQKVQTVIESGLSEEQLKIGPAADRRLSDGMLPGPQTPPAPLLPMWVWIAIAGVSGVVVLVLVLRITARVAVPRL